MSDQIVASATDPVVETPVQQTPPVQSPAEGTVDTTSIPEEPKKEEPRKDRLKERFHELTTQRNLARTDADTLRSILTDLTQVPTPKRSEYSSEDEYQDAVEEYREELRTNRSLLTTAEKKVQKIDSQIDDSHVSEWSSKLDEANISDYDAVVTKSDIPISGEVHKAILAMPGAVGPKIVYHLATNPQVAYELNKLPVYQQLVELGRMKTELQTVRNVETVKQPNPPPGQRVQGTRVSKQATAEDRASWDFETWKKWREEQK